MSLAWLLDFGAGRFAAVPYRQQLQLLHQPAVQALAFAPAQATQVLIWSEHCVPVLNFGLWCAQVATAQGGVLGLYAYAPAPGAAHRLGALWLAAPPTVVRVDDAQACELPPERQAWRAASVACWKDERVGPVPILDLAVLFEPASGAETVALPLPVQWAA